MTISAANQGGVTRATVEGTQAFGQSQPFAVTGRTASQSVAPAAALRLGAVQSIVRLGLVSAFGSHRSATIASVALPAATTVSTDACAFSGSITTSVSDSDGSLSLSSGDSLALTFNQCKDSADESVNGAMVFTIGSVTSASGGDVQFRGSLAFSQIDTTSGTGSAHIEGSVGVAAAITSTSFQIALTVGASALTVTSAAPGYLDTIVFDPGLQLTVRATDGAVTQTDVTLDGGFSAASIGGRVVVATVQPLRLLGSDLHPSSGQVVVTGAAGTRLRVTALDNARVQLDLDGNGDGTYERSGVFVWDTLG